MDIAKDVAEVESLHERSRIKAFEWLETYAPSLAGAALLMCGGRDRAARWMCVKHRMLDGHSAYEALAQGELDQVWDLLIGAGKRT
ncbi:antitoxin Xre/MbcA/ParS toxin-binding domain-containing protein [Dyella psychrodurans]|uniref:antitoxin Xre/MbcA/ParS toxin-binding domain-containing protein n=1 Tax=Dyella psychrodurans TaxID=1927960 RepID=UPI001F1684BF|nr:antitoxin Xre/MbcA/ParS toxin-binding domain-containing protein [Dyella psychrodurans]